MAQRVQPIIDFADIGDFIDQPVKTYSSGMFARLAFAVAINVSPDILIVDEALSVGDTRFQVKCIDKMQELKKSGTTILFVTHAVEQIKRFCTRAVWIRDGRIYEDGEAGQVVDLYENFMRYGKSALEESPSGEEDGAEGRQSFEDIPQKRDMLAAIRSVTINEEMLHTFGELKVCVEYEILDEEVKGIVLGVAIYSKDRKVYVLGANTHLDKVQLKEKRGVYQVEYTIPRLPLIIGEFVIDVGIFNNEGIVNLDYKMSAVHFAVTNTYFSEGLVYMEHEWKW